jgi:NADH-ubiquinone oxidoreductase chain 4
MKQNRERFSTLRTIDIKELIAYSSVSHAAVYLIGAFSNTILYNM